MAKSAKKDIKKTRKKTKKPIKKDIQKNREGTKKKGKSDSVQEDPGKILGHVGSAQEKSRQSIVGTLQDATRVRSNLSLLKLPTRGSKLLEYLRSRASLISDRDSELSSSEEEDDLQRFSDDLKKRKGKKGKKDDRKKIASFPIVEEKESTTEQKKKGKSKKAKKDEKLGETIQHPRLVDEIVTLWKEQRKAIAFVEEQPATTEEEVVEKVKKGKKTKKPKSTKVVRMSEKMIKEAERLAKKHAAEQIQRNEDERLARIEQNKRDESEQNNRVECIRNSLDSMKVLENYIKEVEQKKLEDTKWNLYIKCDYLPVVTHINDMNTYLHLWELQLDRTTPEEASKRTRDVLKLISVMEYLIGTMNPEDTKNIENLKWLRTMFREHQERSMDVTTYRVLRDIAAKMNRIDIPTADFNYVDSSFTLCIWLKVQLPIPLPNPRRPPPARIELELHDVNMQVLLPLSVDCNNMAIRALYLPYDHLSDLSASYKKPPLPDYYNKDLVEIIQYEWKMQKKYKFEAEYRKNYENAVKKRQAALAEIGNVDKFAQTSGTSSEVPPVPKFNMPILGLDDAIPATDAIVLDPSPSEYVAFADELDYGKQRETFHLELRENEVNLRKYRIVGGVYHLNLLFQPPQPQKFVTMEMELTSLVLPKQLERVPFFVPIVLPSASTSTTRTPEQIEEAMKLQEAEFDRLIYVTLKLPRHVMYLEPPTVCFWEPEQKYWSTKDVHDLKHNEEQASLAFRTSRFGCFGFAIVKYSNMPFQGWEIRPETDGSITFQLSAAIINVEFSINQSNITVKQIQNGPPDVLQDTIDKSFCLRTLITRFQEGGLDIFPDHDAFIYVEGVCEKHWPTEHLVYYNLAQLSICYNFMWSRWNIMQGRRSMVFQMREYKVDKQRQHPFSLVLVTPVKATYIKCTEVNPTFSEEPTDEMKFNANLWYLMKSVSTVSTRQKIIEFSKETQHTLAQLLIATRLMSFS